MTTSPIYDKDNWPTAIPECGDSDATSVPFVVLAGHMLVVRSNGSLSYLYTSPYKPDSYFDSLYNKVCDGDWRAAKVLYTALPAKYGPHVYGQRLDNWRSEVRDDATLLRQVRYLLSIEKLKDIIAKSETRNPTFKENFTQHYIRAITSRYEHSDNGF